MAHPFILASENPDLATQKWFYHSYQTHPSYNAYLSFAQKLDNAWITPVDLSNHARYKKISPACAEFRILSIKWHTTAIIMICLRSGIEEDYIEISLVHRTGKMRWVYEFTHIRGCKEDISDICFPYESPNIIAIPELKDVISDFTHQMSIWNFLTLKKVGS
jgi:hypothetical protein